MVIIITISSLLLLLLLLKAIPPIATLVAVAWYVRLYVCRLSHSCTLC